MKMTHYTKMVLSAAVSALCSLTLTAVDWPQEMGPTRSGYTPESVELSHIDPASPEPLWTADAGVGAAAPAVVGDRVYVNGYFNREADLSDGIQESDRAYYSKENELRLPDSVGKNVYGVGLEYPRPNRPHLTNETLGRTQGGPMYLVDEYALCFDLKTGELLWSSILQDEVAVNHYHYPRGTPLVVGRIVYFHDWNSFLTAVDTESGERVWQVDLMDYGANVSGKGTKGGNWSGPVHSAGNIIVPFGIAATGMNVISLDPDTGEKKWMTEVGGSFRGNKTIINAGMIDGKETLVLAGGSMPDPKDKTGTLKLANTIGLDPETGEIRWEFDYVDQLNIDVGKGLDRVTWPSRIPLIEDGVVITSSMVGVKSERALLHAFTVENGEPKALWSKRWPLRHFGQMVVHDGYVYVLDDAVNPNAENPRGSWGARPAGMGAFQCIDVRTGEKAWETKALDDIVNYGGFREGNPHYIIADQTIILHQHSGLIFGKVDPKEAGPFTFVDMSAFAQDGLAKPVIANGHLLIRRLGGQVGMMKTQSGESPLRADGGTLVCFSTESRNEANRP